MLLFYESMETQRSSYEPTASIEDVDFDDPVKKSLFLSSCFLQIILQEKSKTFYAFLQSDRNNREILEELKITTKTLSHQTHILNTVSRSSTIPLEF